MLQIVMNLISVDPETLNPNIQRTFHDRVLSECAWWYHVCVRQDLILQQVCFEVKTIFISDKIDLSAGWRPLGHTLVRSFIRTGLKSFNMIHRNDLLFAVM